MATGAQRRSCRRLGALVDLGSLGLNPDRDNRVVVTGLDAPASSWFTATSALMHYVLGAAGQNAANHERAGSLGPGIDRGTSIEIVTQAWQQLSPEDCPFTRAVANQGLEHDYRAQFLAGIDLIIAGVGRAAGP